MSRLCFSLLTVLVLAVSFSQVIAHDHGGGGYEHGGYDHGGDWGHDNWHHDYWHHDRIYTSDPWYHSDHVYIVNGEAYPYYYDGYPYYYYDPRFYYGTPTASVDFNASF